MAAELAIVGARIRTLDPARPTASAVAVRDGVIVEVIGDGWVFGWGLAPDVFPSGGLDAQIVTQAVGDAPAVVHCADLHTVVASERALTLAGIDGPRAFDEASEIVCVDGRPTGELREASAGALVLAAAPVETIDQVGARQVATLRRQNALGLTGVHVMGGAPSTFDLLRELEARDELTMRLVVPLWQTPATTDEERAKHLTLRGQRGRQWRGGVAKFFIDGVVDSGTAWLEEPDASVRARDRSGPNPSASRRRSRRSPAPGSRSPRTRSATRRCATCLTPIRRRVQLRGCGIASSISRRSPMPSSGAWPPKTWSLRCSRSTSATSTATARGTGRSRGWASRPRSCAGCPAPPSAAPSCRPSG